MNKTTRAASAALCAILVAGCGGGGDGSSGSGSGSNTGTGTGGTSPGNVLFVGDFTGNIAAYPTLAPTASTFTDHLVAASPVVNGTSLAYDGTRDELYSQVSLSTTGFQAGIDVFAHASHAAGGIAPSRRITLRGVEIPSGIALDTPSDSLWAAIGQGSQPLIAVYDHASTLSGSVSPSRAYHIFARNFSVDTSRTMVYAIGHYGEVNVYGGATMLGDHAVPLHTFYAMGNNNSTQAIFTLSVDGSRDIAYLADQSAPCVYIVHGASTADGYLSLIQLALPKESFETESATTSVKIDPAHDRLYVAVGSDVYIFENASTLTANSAIPSAAVSDPGAGLQSFAFP